MKLLNVGEKINKLVVLDVLKKRYKNYLCLCDCGTIKEIRATNVNSGDTKSCGCYHKQISKERLLGTKIHLTHGMRGERFYRIWTGIKTRCFNKNAPKYPIYGGRGIKCLWTSFEQFKDEMYKSYLEHCRRFGIKQTSIDRIDVNGNYHKKNCRWATPFIQANNTRKNICELK